MIEAPAVRRSGSDESGYTLIEMMVSVLLLMVVSGLVMQGTLDMNRLNTQQTNRSEMHGGIRNATALLQQEVGQAGHIAFPEPVTLANAIAVPGDQWVTAGPSVTGLFEGLQVAVGFGDEHEIVSVLEVNPGGNQFRADFVTPHAAGSNVTPAGGFSDGVIPTTHPDGSSDSVLKILGDINSDGSLVYVEYTCDWNEGRMYRNMMPYDAAAKPGLTVEQILLDNLLPNPPDADGTVPPCFTYEERTFGGRTYVINVAIMTTVRTHERDPITNEFQTVTKALLNVAPRNVFNVWQMASLGYENRVQPLPESVEALLPDVDPQIDVELDVIELP